MITLGKMALCTLKIKALYFNIENNIKSRCLHLKITQTRSSLGDLVFSIRVCLVSTTIAECDIFSKAL